MVQINQAVLGSADTAYFVVPLLSLAVVLSAIISLVGIKLWWFKHRLTFDQSETRNGAAGGSQPTVVTRQYSSRDKRHSQQFHASVEVHGVFRKRQEDELEFVRSAELPPVRIRKLSQSTPSLLLLPPSTRSASGIGGGSVPHSDASKYLAPPTREPPRPPITGQREVVMETSTIIEEEAPPFADFEQSFKKANAIRSSHSMNDGGEETVTTPIAPMRINRSISNDSRGGGQKFFRAKGASDSSERRRVMERRPTGYLPPDQNVLQAMQQQDKEAEKEEDKKKKINNNNKPTNNSGNRTERSYLRYEDIDRDGFDDYRHSWEGTASRAAAKDTSSDLEQLRTPPIIAQRSVLDVTMSAYELDEAAVETHAVKLTTEPSPRPRRNITFENRTEAARPIPYDDVERTPWAPVSVAAEAATPRSPFHTPTTPSTGNDHDFEYFIEEKFDQIRHSFQQHEADFLETRVTVSKENELNDDINSAFAKSQTKPQGYGRSIDEDWESFEQLNSTRDTFCEKTNGHVVLETQKPMTTTIRTIERDEYKEVSFDLSEKEEPGTDTEEPLRPQRRATGYVRDIEELYQELSLQDSDDIDISKLDIDSDGSAGSDAPPSATAAVIDADVPKPKSRQKVTFDFKTEEHFLPSHHDDHDEDPDSDEGGSGEPDPDMPKPMQRLTKMRYIETSVEGSEPAPPSLPRAPAPRIVLFGSPQFADESTSLASDSWSAVRQHRYLTEEFQQLSPTVGQASIAAPASVGAAKLAFRNPLAQQPTAGTTDLFVQPRTMRDMKKSQARQNTTIRLDLEPSSAGTEAGC